ncbi:MAG: hypothetical protein NZL90_02565, partial [Aquificaceae bacterium]|nr:hypothetical protein [Aquificaceae bacterium]MDW8236953.1 hypothetical protein [Aquificaceae bacterium]
MSQIGFRYVWLFLLFSFAFALEVDVRSDFLERESSGRIYAYGNAVVSVKNYVINADIVLYDTKLKELYAFGNLKVRSEDGKLELEGQEAFFDISRDEGFFTFVNGRVERLYITASFVKKVQNEYDVSEASLTTCPPDKKELILCVSNAKIGERYAYGGSSTLRFFGLSVFYLPGFILPIGERRSGLLPPEIGSDSDSELIYKQGVYLVFDQNRDATIGFDVRSSGIKGLNFEYRQAIQKSNDFSFNIWVFKEPDFRTYRDERLQNRYRFKLGLDLENIKLKIDKVSDRYFLQDYAKKDDRTAPYLESFVSFSKYIGDAIVYSDFRYFYDTTSKSNSLTLQRLPEVGVYLPSRLIFKDTYLRFRSSFTNFYREEGERTQRLLLSPVLSYQKNFGDRLTSITDIRFDGIYYLNFSNLVSSLAFSQTLRTFLRQNIYGTEFNAGFGTRYRHRSIEGKALGFDVFDRIGYENDIDFT